MAGLVCALGAGRTIRAGVPHPRIKYAEVAAEADHRISRQWRGWWNTRGHVEYG